jgi:putative transcriptional regulator
MSNTASSSAALPIAYVVLRILIIVNWVSGVAILALLVVMPNREWIMSSLELSPSPEAERVIMGLRAVAVIGIAMVPLYYAGLKRLLAIVETVRAGDPFVAANAQRLQGIAWVLFALQIFSLVVGAINKAISTPGHPVDLDAGFSLNGWRKARACATTSKGRCDVAIVVKLDDMLHDRRMTLTELADRIGMALPNLSILKTGKARAIRFSTLDAICEALSCQPGDILRFEPDKPTRRSSK